MVKAIYFAAFMENYCIF